MSRKKHKNTNKGKGKSKLAVAADSANPGLAPEGPRLLAPRKQKATQSFSSHFTTLHMKRLWKAHPIKPLSFVYTFLIVTSLSTILHVLAYFGYFKRLIETLASENSAPLTANLIVYFCFMMGSLIVACKGPYANRETKTYKWFAVGIPQFGLGLLATVTSISTGSLLAGWFCGTGAVGQIQTLIESIGFFLFALLTIIYMTVTVDDAPMYRTHNFRKFVRALAAALSICVFGLFCVSFLMWVKR